MKKLVVLLVANIWLTACVSPGMVQDCRARRDRATQVAAIAAADLKPGWTAQEVRAALGEPDEIVAAKGLSKFDIWKYYLSEDCKTHLGMTAPQTESSSFKAIWSVLIPTPNEAAGFRAQGKPTRGREPTAGRGAGAGPASGRHLTSGGRSLGAPFPLPPPMLPPGLPLGRGQVPEPRA